MTGFSFGRMAGFCRLQLCSTYFLSPRKTVPALVFLIIFIAGLSIVAEEGDIAGMMSVTEDLMLVLISFVILDLYRDMTSENNAINRMLVPASLMEKYAAMYAGTAITSAVIIISAAVLGSAIYTAAGHFFYPDQTDGIQLLFFRTGGWGWNDVLTACLLASGITWFAPFFRRNMGHKAWKICAAAIIYMAVLFLPGILKATGAVSAGTARAATICILVTLIVLNVRWGYLMLKNFEFDRKGND